MCAQPHINKKAAELICLMFDRFSQDAKKRKQFFAGSKPPIELGAVLDTTCRNCGGRGKYLVILVSGAVAQG